MKIKLFRDAIGFSFWHHFGSDGTAIRCKKAKSGLIGIRFDKTCGDFYGVEIGLWKALYFDLCWIHEGQFKNK